MNYNPNVSPNFALWLELDEAERITTVIAYHERNREKLPNQRLHATIHVIIENQLAEQIPAVTDALTRLNHPRLKSGGLRLSAKADWGRHHGSTLKSASWSRSVSC